MLRIAAIFMITWGLIITPALCVAGVLHHPCDPVSTSDHEHDDPCPHESTCPQDPCGVVSVIVRATQYRDPGSMAEFLGAPAPAVAISACRESDVDTSVLPSLRSPPSGRLPFPDSDIPLLI